MSSVKKESTTTTYPEERFHLRSALYIYTVEIHDAHLLYLVGVGINMQIWSVVNVKSELQA